MCFLRPEWCGEEGRKGKVGDTQGPEIIYGTAHGLCLGNKRQHVMTCIAKLGSEAIAASLYWVPQRYGMSCCSSSWPAHCSYASLLMPVAKELRLLKWAQQRASSGGKLAHWWDVKE